MNIRDAVWADLPAIVEIYNAAIPGRLATADLEPIAVESRRAWFEEHRPDFRPIWVLEVEGAIAAWVSLTSFYAGRPAYNATAEISIYISPRHQRCGYGSKLVQYTIDRCPDLGVTTLLSMYFDHNQPSRRLFEKFGFEAMGHLTDIAQLDGKSRGLIIAGLRIPHQPSV